ncbi:GntR family transcriptional regulator [Obesumbacterium proteus]|uniref:aminotransferase-like domain-containing protein n=1 Tax=Obesumbacterium proteus TaxID=82983 RepID=UPI000622309E|nr:PLP-dependent aminotransferase family protein [Obesumbacterium proteus]KKI47655.1 GntR family transcriptional regulator [Obesumbacterium proteus]TBL54500.1 PLP-dependent aminotransferase family protein [Obesumbacterium proteus]
MAKYEDLVKRIRGQITAEIWQVGDKLPSLREQVLHSGLSLMTVMHAYQILESQGWIVSRPQSGYYVAPQAKFLAPSPTHEPVQRAEEVGINAFIFDVLQASRDPAIVPFGSAYPDPTLFPRQQISKSLTTVARAMTTLSATDNLPPGNEDLRKILAKRYAMQGIRIDPEEIVITAGALESLNLSLQAVTQPGDWVIVENPCFYGALQALERLRLKALSIAAHPEFGIDLAALEEALKTYPVRACWLMTNIQNPLGCTLSVEKKQQLVALLRRHNVYLIEDDVYGELYAGGEKPLPAKAFDETGMTMHCSSFSKSLVAGFRVGWVAAGNMARKIQQLQLMSTLSTSAPMQLALANYLATRSYDSHLRRLRRVMEQRKYAAWQSLRAHLPQGVNINYSHGGYFLWVELPINVNATELYHRALNERISIAPGQMFSASNQYTNYFRFNVSHEWTDKSEKAVQKLAVIVREMMGIAD